MESAYRSDEEILQEKAQKLRRLRLQELVQLPPILHRLYVRRVGRVVAGAAALLGAILFLGAALFSMLRSWKFLGTSAHGYLTVWLFAVVTGAFVLYLCAQLLAGRSLLWRLLASLRTSSDLRATIERLSAQSPQTEVKQLTTRLEQLSIGLPLVALSLLAPLTIHFLVGLLISGGRIDARDFDSWIMTSAVLVGHCHLLLAYLSWRYSRHLIKSNIDGFLTLKSDGWTTFGLVVASSLVPGAFLIGLPVVIVAITGILFIPYMFGWARETLARERTEIELAIDLAGVIKR
jgi:hypothetical protein